MGSFGRQLAVNDGALTSTNSAFLRESDLTLPIEDLRARYDADGYLFLKHLLPREEVLEVRKRYFEFLASTGVLKDGTAPVEGIFNPAKHHQKNFQELDQESVRKERERRNLYHAPWKHTMKTGIRISASIQFFTISFQNSRAGIGTLYL